MHVCLHPPQGKNTKLLHAVPETRFISAAEVLSLYSNAIGVPSVVQVLPGFTLCKVGVAAAVPVSVVTVLLTPKIYAS